MLVEIGKHMENMVAGNHWKIAAIIYEYNCKSFQSLHVMYLT